MLTVLLSHRNDKGFQAEPGKRESISITITYTKSYKFADKTLNIIIGFNKFSGDPGLSQVRNNALEGASYVRGPPSLAFWLYRVRTVLML
jgi:hypothetical protein